MITFEKKLIMKKHIFSFLMFLVIWTVGAQKLIQSGPMRGHTSMTEVNLWVQTKRPAKVKFAYYPKKNPGLKKFTPQRKTRKQEAYIYEEKLTGLKRGTTYVYEVYINGKKQHFDYPLEFTTQDIWRWHKPPRDFSFAFGSGAYVNDKPWDRKGSPYGGHYKIYESIADKHPDFMIWGGDNVYLRQGEWNSRERIIYRYTHDRSIPEMQRLLATTAHYAILDDHDFGPNDSDGSFWNKNTTLEVFDMFWANPSVGVGNIKGAITQFSWYDADFFLLDNRYYRDANDLETKEHKTILGKQQWEWLKNALAASRARFKFVVMGGQFLNTARRFETYSNHGFDLERAEIIHYIYKQGIKNVIFLTGDRHESEISVYNPSNGDSVLFDLTVSPFTSGPNTHALQEKNHLRIPGSVIMERNFAIISVKGQRENRHVEVAFYNQDGKLIYRYVLNLKKPVMEVQGR